MSAATARRLTTAVTLTLALALSATVAAFAEPGDGPRGSSEQAQERKDERADAKSSSTPSQPAASESGSSKDKAPAARAKAAERKKARTAAKAGKQKGRAAGGDPRGNNGTVKIDGLAFDDTPGNEPHVGCTFQLDFFGFDAGNTADITLTGQAPTGGGLLWSASNRLVSTDAAGGGQDVDESITLSVSDLALAGVTPHPKQGFHVKLAVDVLQAPGGAKQKVFWISCPTPPAVAGTTTARATGGAGGTRSLKAAPVDRAPLAPTFGAGSVSAQSSTQSTVATRTLGSGRSATSATQPAAQPSALPFTGVEGLSHLLALGLSAAGVGARAHRLGRRRAAGAETL